MQKLRFYIIDLIKAVQREEGVNDSVTVLTHFLEEITLLLKPERCSALCMLGTFSCFPCRLLTFFFQN